MSRFESRKDISLSLGVDLLNVEELSWLLFLLATVADSFLSIEFELKDDSIGFLFIFHLNTSGHQWISGIIYQPYVFLRKD